MKRLGRFILFISLTPFLLLFSSCAPAGEQFQVKWVNDGDTVVLVDGRRVRYIGIDSPEIDYDTGSEQPCGYRARSFNKEFVNGKRVRLEFEAERHDRYGRWLAYLFLADSTFVNQEMIEKGYAWFLPTRAAEKYAKDLLEAQKRAMSAGRGIWRFLEKNDSAGYVGNRRSRRFHRSTCPSAATISARNRVAITSKWDAFWMGFAPAKECVRAFRYSKEAGECK